mmetsp:Transcript_46166/g.97942  ORF Transcript_46166/g.97942 Transcript_46166/m.97942 type:complete len:82 (+) Transcript_46166:95-340(+)
MAYSKKTDLKPPCSGSLFAWSKETIARLELRSGDLTKLHLDAIAYLWEICYDLALGLRVNHGKRKRGDDQCGTLDHFSLVA